MQYLFYTSNLSAPTVESFQEYVKLRIGGISKFISQPTKVISSINKIGGRKHFEIKIEITIGGKSYIAKAITHTLTEGIDKINKQLRRQITSHH